MARRRLTLEEFETGLAAGERVALARAITLVESGRAEDQAQAQDLLLRVLPKCGKAVRLGITGVPGAGKSTFIEAFGGMLTKAGHKVAVLAVDPSSTRTGGSILGDKTRMEMLSRDPNAFIRPSPSEGRLGGVHKMTRETMLLCEAAGYDVIIVETVGAGQNEVTVAAMVDFFLVLMLPNAGDELQGIKKGVLELADMIAVNKADMDERRAKSAVRDYKAAVHVMTPPSAPWQPPVLPCSALKGDGLEEIWAKIGDYMGQGRESGHLEAKRREQQVGWMWAMVEDRLLDRLKRAPDVAAILSGLEAEVAGGETTASRAADLLLAAFWASVTPSTR